MTVDFTQFDGDEADEFAEPIVEVNKYGTVRVNGKTEYQLSKEYYDEYGEEAYVKFLLDEHLPNPRGIKIKDVGLVEKLKKAGLQE